ncbi:electron transport complex subunit RsxC [bacterium]|nr:electron transport complex subunit RsxC [bacterium]
MSGRGLTFRRGGTHPPENKELCDAASYTVLPTPAELVVAMSQHLGAPAKTIVHNRDEVEAGQLIGEASAFISANIHAPAKGTVKGLDIVHIGPVNSPAVTIKTDPAVPPVPEYDREAQPLDLSGWTKDEILARIKETGIVGMGGATFPTHVKLSPPPGAELDVLVINGAECEPYLTADDCLMRNHPVQVLEGTRVIMQACGIDRAVIGIEDNKPEAFQTLKAAAAGLGGIEIVRCRTRYPQGAEKQLIEATVGRKVAPGNLPFTVGVVVQNVATTAAVYEALATGQPLTRRLISITGRGVARPQNVMVPVGTSVAELLEYCGGPKDGLAAVVMGGPMMGRATSDINEPTAKGTSGVLFLTKDELIVAEEDPCLRCGRCVSDCPMGLVPTELMSLAMLGRFEEATDALDCVECGTCAFVCPSNRRLVQWIRLAKWELGRIRRRAQLKQKETEAKAAKS